MMTFFSFVGDYLRPDVNESLTFYELVLDDGESLGTIFLESSLELGQGGGLQGSDPVCERDSIMHGSHASLPRGRHQLMS